MDLGVAPRLLTLHVEDDGCGFALDTEPQPGHFGLAGIRERVALLQGQFALSGAPGAGTRLSITLPWAKEEEDDSDRDLR
jgi:signal transduction histidine kinase